MRSLLRFLFRAADLLLLLLFVGGYAAYFIHPRYLWWLQWLAIGLPVLAVGVAGAAIWLAYRRRWRRFGLHAALLLLLYLRYVPDDRAADADAPALYLQTFNTHHELLPKERLAQGLEAGWMPAPPHVVALQEFDVRYGRAGRVRGLPPETARLLDTLDYRLLPAPATVASMPPRPVLSRLPGRGELLRVDVGDGRALRVVRVALQWQGREVALYNLHLQGFAAERPWKEGAFWRPRAWMRYLLRNREEMLRRAAEAEAIRRLLEAEERPFIVCGDFNSTPNQWMYRHLSAGLQDAFRVAGEGWGATYPARLPLVRIDYVLAGPAWRVVEAAVGPRHFSDHRPVRAVLQLAE